MTDSSIRTFALDYYRKRGATVAPLEQGPADSYRITPKEGASLRVTFADELPAGDREQAPVALTTTSPSWRAILDDLTAEVAVSYRYLVSQPIAHPARTLTQAMPSGWQVTKARLLRVENRTALGLSHRVTFDAPALSARREVMHHHLWDIALNERVTALEPFLYETPTLMIRPEVFPTEATVRALLGRSLNQIDLDTDHRGAELEGELGAMLAETESRTNQYYEQQMGQVLQRETSLQERCEQTRRKLAEARTPDVLARCQQDLNSQQAQLAHAREQRDGALQAISQACEQKLAHERERHELTAVTDLVSICHASYDVLTYDADVLTAEGESVTLQLQYWPVSKQLHLPPCSRCNEPLQGGRTTPEGGWICQTCLQACPGCEEVVHAEGSWGTCAASGVTRCSGCLTHCAACDATVSLELARPSGPYERAVCPRCISICTDCGETSCAGHPVPLSVPPAAAEVAAPPMAEPAIAQALPQPTGAEPAIARALPQPVGVEPAIAQVLPQPVGAEPAIAQALPQPVGAEPAIVSLPAGEVKSTGTLEAPPHIDETPDPRFDAPAPAALRQTIAFSPSRVSDEAREDQTLAALFKTVVGAVTPVAAAPAEASRPTGVDLGTLHACPSCEHPSAGHDLTPCGTCGVPTCQRCIHGPLAPCPACESLAPTVASDPRLQPILARFPELRRGNRTWEVSVTGAFVVAHWSKWGTWGMVTYRQAHAAEPAEIVAAFRCGHLDSLRQMLPLKRKHA